MPSQDAITETLRELEDQLLDPSVRGSRREVEDLLADDFTEFGSSGRVYSRSEMIAALQEVPGFDGPRTIESYEVRAFGAEAAIATYRVRESNTLRSSVWVCEDGRWRMLFHQGTKVSEEVQAER